MNNDTLFSSLQALEDASFPKACDSCGKVFECEKDYIINTTPCEKDPGLSEIQDKKGITYLKLVRNCKCGRPIMDHFGDRRDLSPKGEIKRNAFQKVVNILIKTGLKNNSARNELLNHMSNKKSPILEKLGIFNR